MSICEYVWCSICLHIWMSICVYARLPTWAYVRHSDCLRVQILLGQQAVPGDQRVLPDLLQMGEVNGDIRSRGLQLCLPKRLYDFFCIGRSPCVRGIFTQVVSCLQGFAQDAVCFPQEAVKSVPVKIQIVISFFMPKAIAAAVCPARVQNVICIRGFLIFAIDGIAEGYQEKDFGFRSMP